MFWIRLYLRLIRRTKPTSTLKNKKAWETKVRDRLKSHYRTMTSHSSSNSAIVGEGKVDSGHIEGSDCVSHQITCHCLALGSCTRSTFAFAGELFIAFQNQNNKQGFAPLPSRENIQWPSTKLDPISRDNHPSWWEFRHRVCQSCESWAQQS